MACITGKQRFRDELGANITMSRIVERAEKNRKNRHKEVPIRSYKCGRCGGWHLTSMAKGKPDKGEQE